MIFRRDASPRPSVTPSGRRWASALALGCAASASPALSEPAPPPATPPAPSTKADSKPTTDAHKVDDVVVTAPAERTRVSIDRRSYDIARDLQGGTGSVADALRNVPTLDVDLEGNVRMRGDGVTILVDGRPSTLFSGPGGGQALESIPADQFERVEVISNPTAALGPDGGGGAINLIS